MIRPLQPKYFIYFVELNNDKGLMIFDDKPEMNLWLAVNGDKHKYLHVVSGFTLEERKKK